MYLIGQLARAAGVNVETIRYYERCGLLQQPSKPAQGYRRYPEQALTRLRFIKRAQKLGFSLSEIAALLELDERECQKVRELAAHKLELVETKIHDLQRLEQSLKSLIHTCDKHPASDICPVIDSLTHKD